MNKWFVVHDLLAFKQHPNMISNVVKGRGIEKPKFSLFGRIRKNDLIVYYATKNMVVVGIFRVASNMLYIRNDNFWGEVVSYEIEPHEMPLNEHYLDFKSLVTDFNTHFDMFPKKMLWGNYLQGKTCLFLSEEDFLIIKKAMSQEKHMKTRERFEIAMTRWHERYGKTFELLFASLTKNESAILMAIMNYEEKGHGSVGDGDLALFLNSQPTNHIDDLLSKLKRKHLLKFMGRRKGQHRFALTKRGRTLVHWVRARGKELLVP